MLLFRLYLRLRNALRSPSPSTSPSSTGRIYQNAFKCNTKNVFKCNAYLSKTSRSQVESTPAKQSATRYNLSLTAVPAVPRGTVKRTVLVVEWRFGIEPNFFSANKLASTSPDSPVVPTDSPVVPRTSHHPLTLL